MQIRGEPRQRFLALRPGQGQFHSALGRCGAQEQHSEIGLAESRIVRRHGECEIEVVANPQVGYTQHGCEQPVEHGNLELVLTAEDLEADLLQHVDYFALAMDVHPMHGRLSSSRVPHQRDVPSLQPLRLQDPDHLPLVEFLPTLTQVHDRVVLAQEERAFRVLWNRHRIRGHYPARRGGERDLVVLRPKRPRARPQNHGSRNESGYHAAS